MWYYIGPDFVQVSEAQSESALYFNSS